jgi:hypothetical protein
MKHTPIQTTEVKLTSGKSLWEATTTIGILPCKVVSNTEKEAIRLIQSYINRVSSIPA